ncbi:phosphatase PAP2/dual specificity phosphatase family protein [Pseudorhodoferax sp. Leaf267]|uniref:phosphatase PAP2/dual specificity phosphatase family protein n=1 Tax=Pseudorhodoferax sp. Leaf267 TaxID=1736316 RepID=UPI0006F27BF6|nr:phosphatase PAP2/dual specificity phosphatase family protein [Pseudorhodoferax sp. Leaf267]KQP21776.1 phosphatase [Pseudorhodoferax sp. Leaf267]
MKTQRLWKRAATWLVLLGPLFYATYGLANWWAGTRSGVPTMAFAWERQVPFWPWTIFPYWTINVFYAVSLFLARNRHTMDRHALRLVSATLIACTCFMVWPLQFSFGQPAVQGAPAFLFAALRGFDQSFNQAPSLHIALAVILWDWYRQFLRPLWARWVLHVWTFAICASVLTTWQHHFFDIPTGALLGLFCVWLWPLERRVSMLGAWRCTRDAQRHKLAAYYGLGAALLLALAIHGGGMLLWLGWAVAALALVALNYLGLGARGFQMDGRGRMGWAARWLFAPYRLGAAVNAWLWTRRLPASVEVQPGLRLGRLPGRAEWLAAGQPRLVSLCAELQVPAGSHARCVPLLDLAVPPAVRLQRAALVIEAQRRQAGGAPVWVCCALGFSRSAAAVIAWLGRDAPAGGLAAAEAAVRRARPQIVLGDAWRVSLARVLEGRPHE